MISKLNKIKALGQIPLWMWLILAVFALSVPFFMGAEASYDDLLYYGTFSGAHPRLDSWIEYPRWMASHWLTTNGRWGNLVMPSIQLLPKWLCAVVFSVIVAMMYYYAVVNAGVRSGWIPVALCTVICLALPWWDYMVIFDCQANYVWGSAAALWTMYILFSSSRNGRWWDCIVVLVGGCCHEAASLPLLGGIILYALIARPRFSRRTKALLGVFTVGSLIVTLSPGLMARAAGNGIWDDTPWMIFWKSDCIAGLLWLAVIIFTAIPYTRPSTLNLFRKPQSIFIWAAGASACISVYSSIVGRSGWFAQLYALIALSWWIGQVAKRPRRGLAVALATVTVAQLCVTSAWQLRLGAQHREFINRYIESADGVVFVDGLLRDTDVPWTVLNKAKGIPDSDDTGLLETIAWFYRSDAPYPIALPGDACGYVPIATDSMTLANGDVLMQQLPAHAVEFKSWSGLTTTHLIKRFDKIWIATTLPSGGFYVTPLVLDPGDRIPRDIMTKLENHGSK